MNLSDFVQLDTKSLLAVNGGSDCGGGTTGSTSNATTESGENGYCFVDNSSSNYAKGTETHIGGSVNEVLAEYQNYENMYFIRLQ